MSLRNSTPLLVGVVWGTLALCGPTHANPAHLTLLKMGEKERNATLTAFMRQSGERCVVTRSFFQGIHEASGDAFWNVACQNSSALSIMIKNNATGSTKVLECGVMKAIANVECFKKFK